MSSEDQSEPKTCEDYTACNKQESTCSKQESICLNLSGEPSISDKAPFVRLIVLEPACSFGAKINIGPNSSPEPRTLGIAMETNEDGVLNGEEDNGILRFHLKDVDLIFENSTQPNKSERPILHLKPACFADDEWYANVQVRIFIARNGELFRMTTTQMFELGKRCRPLELQVEPDVDAIKLELRFVYLSYHKMPKFEADGDLQIFFSDKNDDPIHVDKSLLALYAPKLVNSIENIPPHGSFDVQSGVNREQFLELLYQVYRTNRPVWADLKTLCDAVNKLGGPILLWKLRQFFVDDSQQSTMKKASDAAEFGIDEATRQLCYDAVKSGEWNQLNERGFDAQKFFGHEIYRLLVMPAVIEAMKDRNSVDLAVSTQLYEQKYPLPKPRFANPYEAGNLYVIQLQVDNVLYYVNRGLLKIYGCLDKLAFVQNNVYRPLVSPDLKQELDQSNLQLGQIVTPVLELMYGVIDHVPANILPACLIFAHDHGIRAIVEDLEKFLIDEPNDKPETLLNHLLTAEKYNLMNLRRRSLWQLELNKLQNIGLEMIALPDYQKLTPSMQMNVEDRMCRGWAQSNPKLATGKPTNTPAFYLQFLGPERAKAEPVLDEMDLQTVKLIGAYSFEQLVDG